ncbi:hypothetical protein QCD85_23715, partial [Paenibacillus sp. PsM32]|uniref:hypothetical protein n=1 Tax=Paenibacillus sp. PsM32 TaxID=3030536 RepID=UPI00263B173D
LLTVYMKSAAKKSKDEDIEPPKLDFGMRVRPSILIAVALVSSVIGAGASGFIVNRIVSVNYEKELSILGAQTTAPSPTPT